MWRYPSSSADWTASTHACPLGTCQTPRPSMGMCMPSARTRARPSAVTELADIRRSVTLATAVRHDAIAARRWLSAQHASSRSACSGASRYWRLAGSLAGGPSPRRLTPGIYDVDAGAIEVGDVAGCERRAVGAADGGDRFPSPLAAASGDRVMLRGSGIDRQDLVSEGREDLSSRGEKDLLPASVWQPGNAVPGAVSVASRGWLRSMPGSSQAPATPVLSWC
jgi:hypothetical protein